MSQFKPDTSQYVMYALQLIQSIGEVTSLKELRLLHPSVHRFTVSTAKYGEIPDLRLEVLHTYRQRFLYYVSA